MQTFEEWWGSSALGMTLDRISAENGWDAALTTANERIRDLEADRDEWKTSTIDANKRFRKAEALVLERLSAMCDRIRFPGQTPSDSEKAARAALAEVAAIRKGEKQ